MEADRVPAIHCYACVHAVDLADVSGPRVGHGRAGISTRARRIARSRRSAAVMSSPGVVASTRTPSGSSSTTPAPTANASPRTDARTSPAVRRRARHRAVASRAAKSGRTDAEILAEQREGAEELRMLGAVEGDQLLVLHHHPHARLLASHHTRRSGERTQIPLLRQARTGRRQMSRRSVAQRVSS